MEMFISEAAVVVSFEQDNFVRLKQQKAEEIYGNISAKPSTNTNVADTQNPSLPRILIKDVLKGVGISQVSANLALGFDKNDGLDKQVETVMEYTDIFFNDTKIFAGESNIKDTGIISSILIPSSKPLNELNPYIFKTFCNLEPLGEVVSSFYKIGFKTENGLFLGVELGTYSQAQDAQGKISSGYLVKIDINNKPFFTVPGNPILINPSGIKEKFKSFIYNDIEKFFKKKLDIVL